MGRSCSIPYAKGRRSAWMICSNGSRVCDGIELEPAAVKSMLAVAGQRESSWHAA